MRRDYFTLTVRPRTGDGDSSPELVVTYEGPSDAFGSRVSSTDNGLTGADVDVAFRYQADSRDGVLSVTNRLTGEYILEVNTDIDSIEELVGAARAYPDDSSYVIRIERAEQSTITWEKETLLVYDADGNLVRERSLIPSGVEL